MKWDNLAATCNIVNKMQQGDCKWRIMYVCVRACVYASVLVKRLVVITNVLECINVHLFVCIHALQNHFIHLVCDSVMPIAVVSIVCFSRLLWFR